jgi:hypothetical protein
MMIQCCLLYEIKSKGVLKFVNKVRLQSNYDHVIFSGGLYGFSVINTGTLLRSILRYEDKAWSQSFSVRSQSCTIPSWMGISTLMFGRYRARSNSYVLLFVVDVPLDEDEDEDEAHSSSLMIPTALKYTEEKECSRRMCERQPTLHRQLHVS